MLVVSRLLLGIVGAGFVVGIRMVSEWFPPADLGTAEGVYGGWGNFGASAAAFGLPALATWIASAPVPDGWRWAIGLTGVDRRRLRRRLPAARAGHARGRRLRALDARRPASRSRTAAAVFGLAALTVPVWAVLGVIAWRVWDVEGHLDPRAGRRRRR